jgi:hypothetical protein
MNSALHLIPRAWRAPVQQVGMTSSDDVDNTIALLAPTLDALNASIKACGAFPASDLAAWNAVVVQWHALTAEWDQDKAGSVSPGPIYGAGILQRADTIRALMAQYSAILDKACPGQGVPVPQPQAPGGGQPAGSWLCRTLGVGCATSAADAIKWAAILGVVGVAAWYLGPLIATVAGVGAGAIRKRVEGPRYGDLTGVQS